MTAGGPDTHDTHHVDAGPALRRDLALATWGLFVGLALLLLAGGLFGTLLGVRAETEGLATGITGLIAAAYYLGFVVGSRLTLSSLGRVGHIRVYAALAALLTAAMLGVGLTGHWAPWALLRLVTGLCFAGQYVVAESWLNDLATNANRGRLLAIYNVVTIAAFAVGQAVVFAFDAVLVTGFAVCAIAASLAVVPVTLSEEAVAPKVEEAEHISLRELSEVVPTGVGSCFLVGIAHGAVGGLPAVYATRVGLPAGWVGLFAAAPSVGGVILQWPISAASDDLDRRAVGLAAAVGAVVTALVLVLTPDTHWMVLVWFGVLGGLSYPLYSIAGAYTNDWIEPETSFSRVARSPARATTTLANWLLDGCPANVCSAFWNSDRKLCSDRLSSAPSRSARRVEIRSARVDCASPSDSARMALANSPSLVWRRTSTKRTPPLVLSIVAERRV